MATAKTTAEFKAALARNTLSFFNLMWATAEGDIGYVQTGQAPLRPEGFNWSKLVPGWTSRSLYYGDLPFAELPALSGHVGHDQRAVMQHSQKPLQLLQGNLLRWELGLEAILDLVEARVPVEHV